MVGRILVIEDDQQVLRMMTDLLESDGYEVIGLAYPDLVLQVVAHERPDLILMDIMLPKKSGVEVADQLWVNGFGATPMIALSASFIMADLARQSPFFECVLRKPFDMDELLGDVRTVLDAHAPTSVPAEIETPA
jgi:CheY-like chemotaxis protein